MEAEFFKVDQTSGKARACTLNLEHGQVKTPIFMPVGTRASVKMLSQEDLEQLNAQIILGNTYHLFLRPGHELIESVGNGLHGFMNWDRPILTDSGGFQVYSLSKMRKMSEEGVAFQSHIDGSTHMLSPEKSMEIQKALGSDIVMVFDECPALPATEKELRESLELTLRWARRCRDYPLRPYQKLFGIVQGGLDYNLRIESLERLMEMDFPGIAIGGLSVGEDQEERKALCEKFVPQMPKDRPRYLMGVGTPLDIMHAIKQGIDMFDCVMPTRNARNGQAFTAHGPLNIKKARFKEDTLPLDPSCSCRVCKKYKRAYIRHLFMVKEYLAGQLLTYHNIHFYLRMVDKARQEILQQSFDEYYLKFYKDYITNLWN